MVCVLGEKMLGRMAEEMILMLSHGLENEQNHECFYISKVYL